MPPPTEFKELRKKKWNSWQKVTLMRTILYGVEYVMEMGLLVQNKRKATTFIVKVRQDVLDLTICRTEVQKLIYGWRVSDAPSLSNQDTYLIQALALFKYCRKNKETLET